MPSTAENVIERLDATRQKWWLFSLLTTTALAVSLSFGIFLAFMFADALATLSPTWLRSLCLVWLSATIALLLVVGRRLLRGQRSLEAMARRVEIELPELGSHAINLVQLAEDRPSVGDPFREAAVRQAAAGLESISFDRAAAQESRRRRFAHCMQTPRDLAEALVILALLMAAAVVCQSRIPHWTSAASRLLTPWRFVPSIGSVEILNVSPGDADVLVGENVEIAAEIKNPQDRPHQAVLLISRQNEPETRLAMTADQRHRHYRLTIPAVLKTFRYRLEIGDSQTAIYSIGVREKPVVERADVTFHYPAYLGRKDETFPQSSLDLEGPQYTVAELRLRTSTPVVRGYLESGNRQFLGKIEEGGRLAVCSMPLTKDGAYTVRLFDDAGHGDAQPRLNRVTATPDKPPVVELLKPVGETSAAPGSELIVVVRAGDDHGLGRLQLEMKTASAAKQEAEDDAPTVLKQWSDFDGDSITSATRRYRWTLKPGAAKPGETVFLRAVAWDKRMIDDGGVELRPQRAASSWLAVKIIAKEVESAAVLKQLEGIHAAIWKLLEKQLAARTATGAMLPKESPADRASALADVRLRQIDIQKSTAQLAGSIADADRREQTAIKRVLGALAAGEMVQAVALCDELMKSTATSRSGASGEIAKLTASQDKIIAVLQKLLDVVRQAEIELSADRKNRVGANLPDDAKRKFEELRDRLEKFLKQQKKVIEASENLAKKPVEDFTEKEKELLRGLAAAEDDLSKFINELHTDLSKLPEQDFSNPSTAKELIEIQTELKEAEDALLKKSVDIAVPLEQLGYERAEELKTNIEKWLPDSPDREKWSQEESPTDKDKEAPMAELPGELEDMIGDLMEQEEDLLDEMEDVSSSAADSLDKGAGWDAVDGPISNNSAKGVTGNRLPNGSEIAGRSGEGRQGKSSGEFVGDESVGKGGRKTPSRLTPDANVKGQIKDHSRESTGGATGGGKESGKGGEGLEGPVPRQAGSRDAQRLAGRQAALRNKAEGINLQLQVSNFQHADLKKLVEAMSQVERDLKAGRYQNALRQRNVLLDALGDVKRRVEGRFEVRRDATTNLPADIQKKILGGMKDPSPAGWEELNREYFERLAGGEEEKAEKSAEKPAEKSAEKPRGKK